MVSTSVLMISVAMRASLHLSRARVPWEFRPYVNAPAPNFSYLRKRFLESAPYLCVPSCRLCEYLYEYLMYLIV